MKFLLSTNCLQDQKKPFHQTLKETITAMDEYQFKGLEVVIPSHNTLLTQKEYDLLSTVSMIFPQSFPTEKNRPLYHSFAQEQTPFPPDATAILTETYRIDDTFERFPLLIQTTYDSPLGITTVWVDYNDDTTVYRYTLVADYRRDGSVDGKADYAYSIMYQYVDEDIVQARDIFGNLFTYGRDAPLHDIISTIYNIMNQDGYSYLGDSS